jgi:alkanesulfonate monooxygenase SsuD/methylene tetrahydromethanopterin reductase-like flavin-dependent oxidoreductase (luciferase family)
MTNVVVSPRHATVLVAKQLATIEKVSGGRLDVGLGIGTQGQDDAAMGAPMSRRRDRVDQQAAELRRLWSGEPPVPGTPPLGPSSCSPAGRRCTRGCSARKPRPALRAGR